MINLNNYKNQQEVFDLMAECMWPDEERIKKQLNAYKTEDDRSLLGEISNNELIGLIGIKQAGDEFELLHIAVKKAYRGKGIAKKMIDECIRNNNIKILEAETDKDAVEFYKRTGFTVTSIGEKYPGRERFKCIWK
jgi:ribosomal protein S18 acetylase RimI-like enzyme